MNPYPSTALISRSHEDADDNNTARQLSMFSVQLAQEQSGIPTED